MSKKPSLFDHLQQLTAEVAGAKKLAAAPTPADPGGHAGASNHPTAHVDNHGQKPSEGERSKENERDVEEAEGAPSVNNASDATDRQDQVQLNIGTHASATGEEPSVEDAYKGTKDDPGTSSPFTTEDGEKYGQMSFGDVHKVATDLGNAVLADYANGFGLNGAPAAKPAQGAKPAAAPASKTAGAPAAPAQQIPPAAAADLQAGYELAASMGLNKQAAEINVTEFLQAAVQDAVDDAERVIGVIKQAAEEESEPSSEGGGESGGGSTPPAAPADGGGAAPGGGGAPDLGALLGGGGGGAPAPGGAEPSLEAQPPSEDEALQELAMALQELGIPVEALAAAAGGAGGGGMAPPPGGGAAPPPPGAGGGMAPPPDAGAPPMGKAAAAAQLANHVQAFMRSGRFQIKEARTKRSRDLRDRMKGHVLELTRR